MLEREKILDDLAKMAGGTLNVVSGLRGEVKQEIKGRIDELALKMDWVPREEFERLETLLSTARVKQEAMNKRLEELEEKINTKT